MSLSRALEVEGLTVRYGQRVAVQPTSFAVPPATIVALVGPNGAGKSSVIKALAALVPHGGRVRWHGRDLAALEPRARGRVVSYLPQAPTAHWPLPARELIGLARLPHRALGERETAADEEAVVWALRQLELEELAGRAVDRLSGGERARVLLARALAVRAPLLLADEPVASLDPYHGLHVMEVLRNYADEGNVVVAVLHDLQLAARFCGRIVLMHDGAIVGDGSPAEVLSAAALRRYYRVEPHIGAHAGQPLVVPWDRLPP